MGLRQQAAADLASILEDAAGGFGWPITVTDPDGHTAVLTGFSNDISHQIDPNTGQAVSGRKVSVFLRLAALTAAGLGEPVGVADGARKPWVIAFADINGKVFTFMITHTDPDRDLGVAVCFLETYQP